MKILLDSNKATEADKRPYVRSMGFVCGLIVVLSIMFVLSSEGLRSVDGAVLSLLAGGAVVGYLGGWVVGWFFWGLYFEPHVEARKKRQGAA